MAAPTATTPWLEAAFLTAKEDFLRSLDSKTTSRFDFSKLTTADDVYKAADEIQRQQAKTKSFRGLGRIKPFIEVLQEYGGVADTFAQVKPEILCFIWGPLKFLLQAASALTAAFDKIVKVLGDIGLILPSFEQYRALFPRNDEIRRVLCLFYEEILSLYAVLLNFVTNKRLNVILEPFWPGVRAKIGKIQENIEHYRALLTENVALEDITRAQRARRQALEEYERAAKFRDHQTFSTIRNEIRPETHHERLDDVLRRTSKGSGEWLTKQDNFMRWLDPVDRTVRYLWLCGIPGAGKTYLASNVIQRLQRSGQCVLFAFISHEHQSVGTTLSVLKSLLFQALEEVPSLQPILPDSSHSDHKKLSRDQDFVKDLLCKVLTSIGPSFIVLDGLDEIEELSWKDLLSTVLEIKEHCVETQVLVSSQEVQGIARTLKGHVATVRVDKNNRDDIQAFVRTESHNLLLELESCGASKEECSGIRAALESIAQKSEGMFLYAKLVMHVVKDHRTLPEIQSEVENLPDGLNQAYGRIISRIEEKVTQKLRTVVHIIFLWLACAGRPLREEELLQILVIDIGADDFGRGQRDHRDIRQACGPIIEVLDGVVRFVHFSAKEYLLHEQSNNFVNLADAHLNAALTCITYLSYSSLDILFSAVEDRADMESQILRGDFVLLDYAALEYMEHVKGWMKHKGPHESASRISAPLRQLSETRGNDAFDGSAPLESFMDKFALFQDDPDLQNSLANAASFLTGAKMGIITVDETAGPSAKDPLTLLSALAKFRQYLEETASNCPSHHGDCPCQKLKKLYTPQFYHCGKVFCGAYIRGFPTKEVRDWHLEVHSRSFKCPESDCFFADQGFPSSTELASHIASAHRILDMPVAGISNSGLTVLPPQDQFNVLEDAIMGSRLDTVRHLTTEGAPIHTHKWIHIIILAAQYSTPEPLFWLLNEFTGSHAPRKSALGNRVLNEALATAIEGENLPNIKLLLSRGANIMEEVTVPVDRNHSAWGGGFPLPGVLRALRRWNGGLMKFLVEECGVTLPPKWPDTKASLGSIFGPVHLSAASPEDVRNRVMATQPYVLWPEAYALGPFFAVRARLPSMLKLCLENGADPNAATAGNLLIFDSIRLGPKAIEITELLLEYGANPNVTYKIRGSFPTHETVLYWVASRVGTGDGCCIDDVKLLLRYRADPNMKSPGPLFAAVRWVRPETVKLLLQHGADPYSKGKTGNKDVTGLAGMKKIEGYFGRSWEDIVRRIQGGEDLERDQTK